MKKYTFLLSLILTSSYIVCAEAGAQPTARDKTIEKIKCFMDHQDNPELAVRTLIEKGHIEYTLDELKYAAGSYYNLEAFLKTIAMVTVEQGLSPRRSYDVILKGSLSQFCKSSFRTGNHSHAEERYLSILAGMESKKTNPNPLK